MSGTARSQLVKPWDNQDRIGEFERGFDRWVIVHGDQSVVVSDSKSLTSLAFSNSIGSTRQLEKTECVSIQFFLRCLSKELHFVLQVIPILVVRSSPIPRISDVSEYKNSRANWKVMECNKDEAVRAKEIAERKFRDRDYAGAKKFALKAQNLYPALEGIPQFLINIEVYISAENKVSGEMDWYGILGVNPFTDDETIRKQYRKLALNLHPDKNKSLGAEGAFKLVSEAWSLISDKAKRLAYNQKRSSKGFQHNTPNHAMSQSEVPSTNGFSNFNKNVTANGRNGNNNPRAQQPTSVPPPQKKAGTFWTICNRCKTHYEYLRIYLNHTLICPTCKEHFRAIEKSPPPNIPKSGNQISQQQHQNSQQHAASNNPGRNYAVSQNTEAGDSSGRSFNNTMFQWGPHSKMTGFGSTEGSSSVAARAANVVHKASEKVSKERDGAPSIAEWERSQMSKRTEGSFNNIEKPFKKRRTDEIQINGDQGFKTNMTVGRGAAGTRELFGFEIRNMLMDKARSDIRKKVQEWKSTAEAKNTNKHKQNKKTKGTLNDKTPHADKHGESTLNGNKYVDGDSLPVASNDTVKEDQTYITINVPDPDFHNFDLDRTEQSFEEDQIWAAYDDDDGMPRYYARIHKVISLKPFKMSISWLTSRSNSELGPIDWVGSGFYKTSGNFRAGKQEIFQSLNSFSHKVRWTKGTRGIIRIFPGKGEVWALYRNWSPDWNQHTPDEVIHKYDMVEVVEDFEEDQGVLVTPLIKVAGFRTVFNRQGDLDQARRIPKEELFRFSHQVPNYLLTGQEAHNAPKGCRELDPAATPLDLLQTETEEANEALGDGRKLTEASSSSST
ncbi:DnaJ-like subfamily B member 14 [Senna tora]|uniref:DnaJ-like subfamily B member 14 n=1 Tax=Senna tora TaxID=362788 RepID=A0A834T7J9_9FABA|nr:DnaJ-like subfamily B member 14 [Senna tora]